MARIIPSGWREMRATGAAGRELETLALLADAPTAARMERVMHSPTGGTGC